MIHDEFDKQSIGKDRKWPDADDHFRYYNQTDLKSRVNQTYGKNHREEEVFPGLNYAM